MPGAGNSHTWNQMVSKCCTIWRWIPWKVSDLPSAFNLFNDIWNSVLNLEYLLMKSSFFSMRIFLYIKVFAEGQGKAIHKRGESDRFWHVPVFCYKWSWGNKRCYMAESSEWVNWILFWNSCMKATPDFLTFLAWDFVDKKIPLRRYNSEDNSFKD